jgi:hypothetical protein
VRNGTKRAKAHSILFPAPPKIFYTGGFRDYLSQVVDHFDGDKTAAAAHLGISAGHLRSLIAGRSGMGGKTCRGAGVSMRKQFYLPGAVDDSE